MKAARRFSLRPESTVSIWFNPGDTIPPEYEHMVTNPKCIDWSEKIPLEELPYEKWTVPELQTWLVNHGLDKRGSKQTLVDRAYEHLLEGCTHGVD